MKETGLLPEAEPPAAFPLSNPEKLTFRRTFVKLMVGVGLLLLPLFLLSGLWFERLFQDEFQSDLDIALAKPGSLIQQGFMDLSVALDDLSPMFVKVGKVLETRVLSRDGTVYYSQKHDEIGQTVADLTGLDFNWFYDRPREPRLSVEKNDDGTIFHHITPIFLYEAPVPSYYFSISVDNRFLQSEANQAKIRGWGTAFTLYGVTLFIIGLFLYYSVITRLIEIFKALPVSRLVRPVGNDDELLLLRKRLKVIWEEEEAKNIRLNETLDALRQNEVRFRNFAESAADWYWELSEDRKFIFISHHMVEQLKGNHGNPLGAKIDELGFEPVTIDGWHPIYARFNRHEPFRGFVFAWRDADGKRRYVRLNGIPILEIDGTFSGFRGTALDITGEMKAEFERENVQRSSLQLQKMESVGKIASMIAHDFNNNLSAIVTFSESAKIYARKNEPDNLKAALDNIIATAHNTGETVSQLLSIGREESEARKLVRLEEEFEGLKPLLIASLKNKASLEIEESRSEASIEISPSGFKQALLNLVINARDAMPDGGTIFISWEIKRLSEEEVLPHNVTAGRYVLLCVRDTGEGMSEELMARIFDPFFTTKGQESGTGLGLSSIFSWVQKSKGFITVESKLGQGSTFCLHFPYVPSETEAKKKAKPLLKTVQTVPVNHSDYTVLLVDDMYDVRFGTRLVLEEAGYHVLEAEDGIEALKVAEGFSDDIHLLISDTQMDGLNGITLAQCLYEKNNAIKVVLISGAPIAMPERSQPPFDRIVCMTKPFVPKALLDVLEGLLTEDET